MSNQSELKREWIFKTLDRMPEPLKVKAELIEAVFNIPLNEAETLLNDYKRGLYHV